MPLGIGGGGIAGLAFEVLPPPVATSATAVAGGSLTAGTYKYYITAINANGETTVSNELTGTTASSNLTITLVWGAVTGATGYKIYRTAAGGATGTELLLTTVGAVTTYNDAAVGTPAGAFPVVNTASAANTYVAPTKYFPFTSESLKFVQDTIWRRPIMNTVDIAGAVPGNVHIEGDIEMEALEDVVPYFLMAARTSVVKTGSSNYTYVFTPTNAATPSKTLSLTFQRVSGAVFGYVGCVVTATKFTIDNGLLKVTFTILGSDEASQAAPTATFPTTVPFGAGQYSIEIPTGTPVTDTDTFEWTADDSGESQFRLKSTGRGAQFIKYGERTCTTHLERDFVDRTNYDAFKAYVAQSITLTATKGANNSISILCPQAVKDTYETNLSSQGDMVRSVINLQNVLSASPATYQITIKTQENIN